MRKARPGEVAGVGDRALAPCREIRYRRRARRLRRPRHQDLDRAKQRTLGIFRALPGGGGRLAPIDKKQLGRELTIPAGATGDAAGRRPLRGRVCAAAPRIGPGHGARGRAARIDQEREGREPDRDQRPRHPACVPARRAQGGGGRAAAVAERTRGLAQGAVRHHRSGRRQGPRRRRSCRARQRSQEQGRPCRLRRHRRRRRLCAARQRARPRGADPRQLGLLPGSGRADAAGGHLQRSVLAAPARGPRRAGGADGDRRRRTQALAHIPPRADPLGGEALLPAGAARHRRLAGRRERSHAWVGARAALCRLSRREARARRTRTARSRHPGTQDRPHRPQHRRPGDDAGAARQPPADRGVHDPRQCRRGGDARARPRAADLSRA